MRVTSRVFAIIGLVCSIIIFFGGLMVPELGIAYIAYGLYATAVSIACLTTVNGRSKTAVIIAAIFNIPVMFIGSIFMFCIKSEDLY